MLYNFASISQKKVRAKRLEMTFEKRALPATDIYELRSERLVSQVRLLTDSFQAFFPSLFASRIPIPRISGMEDAICHLKGFAFKSLTQKPEPGV